MPTIAEIAGGDDFSNLFGAVTFIDANTDAELANALQNGDNLTVFAPDNGAFARLASDLGYTGDTSAPDDVLAFIAENVPVETLRAVVEYHVLTSAKFAAEIAGEPTLTTLQGGTITPELPVLNDNEPDLLDPTITTANIQADNGIVHVIDRVLLPVDLPDNDIATIGGQLPGLSGGFDTNTADFDLLTAAVEAAGLTATLSDENADVTVFAPNDGAFLGLITALGFQGGTEEEGLSFLLDALDLFNQGNGALPLLTSVLTYHVAPQSLQSSQVLAQASIDTLQGGTLMPMVDGDTARLQDAAPGLLDPALIALDLPAANGIIHVLDGVLFPADLLASDGANDVDFVVGTAAADTQFLGLDRDFFSGLGGDDIAGLGDGNDVGLGGDGNDALFGGTGSDVVDGGTGNDEVYGGTGNDHAAGDAGDDTVGGGQGNDFVSGRTGADVLYGGAGEDGVYGGADADIVFGGAGNDTLGGGEGDDTLYAGSGSDTVFGGSGDDRLVFIDGPASAFGGDGADTFVINDNAADVTVEDFEDGADLIDLSVFQLSGFDAIAPSFDDTSGSVTFTAGAARLTLTGVTEDALSADDFLF